VSLILCVIHSIRNAALSTHGFKPLEAEDRELRVYGFPRRPTENPELLKRWQKVYDRKIQFIRPVFRSMDWKRRRIPGKAGLKTQHGVEQSTNWSGAVVHVHQHRRETSLVGNSAEWIVEALEIDTSEPELASYGSVYFDGCVAGASDQLLQAGDGNTTTCLTNGKVISRAEIEGPQLVRCVYERFPSTA
jgi:Peptidase A4 family